MGETYPDYTGVENVIELPVIEPITDISDFDTLLDFDPDILTVVDERSIPPYNMRGVAHGGSQDAAWGSLKTFFASVAALSALYAAGGFLYAGYKRQKNMTLPEFESYMEEVRKHNKQMFLEHKQQRRTEKPASIDYQEPK